MIISHLFSLLQLIQSSFFVLLAILTISILMRDKDFEKFITNSLAEDLGDGDHSSLASIPIGCNKQSYIY